MLSTVQIAQMGPVTELLGEELWSTALSQPKDDDDDDEPDANTRGSLGEFINF